jgi:hypothetical protein
MEIKGENVRNVISGLGNQSDPRPDGGRLPCMAVGPLSRSATIKELHVGAREPMFTVPQCPHKPYLLNTIVKALKRGERSTTPPTVDHRLLTVTATANMSSSSSAQGTSM